MKEEPANRLRAARIAAGYKTAAVFARENGVPSETYRSHEAGRRALTVASAKQYAALLNVSWTALMFGESSEIESTLVDPTTPMTQKQDRTSLVSVAELDVRAHAGAGGLEEIEVEKHRWQMPKDMIRGQTTSAADALRIISVYGDSMAPTLVPGQRIMVDTEDRSPSPPGLFVVWDGLGLVVKRVALIPHSDPLTVRLSSDNSRYEAYERTLNEAHINGRVIGLWQWT